MKKTVLITGASRGIGAGIARMFGERNWNVVLTYLYRESGRCWPCCCAYHYAWWDSRRHPMQYTPL